MGTATTMNSLAETLGLSLKGCAVIPAPYRERAAMAYRTGKAAVEMVLSDRRPSQILTRAAFENAIRMTTALGGSTNAQIHIAAIARHAGIDIDIADWERLGYDVPLLVNLQPAGEYLGEAFHRAGGVPAVLWELKKAGKLNQDCLTCDGGTIGARAEETTDRRVVFPYEQPMMGKAGFLVMRGNIFDSAIMKTSVIDEEFRRRFLSHPEHPGMFEARAVVFDGSEDYHARLNDPALGIDEHSILVMRQAGPVGWPGSAEVVNMQPPDALLKRGVRSLPTIGDGRQSGTSGSPSILHVTPEAALGAGLALLRTGDMIRVDIPKRRVDLLLPEAEIAARRAAAKPAMPADQTPWQHIYRAHVGPLSTGACLDFATAFAKVAKVIPRHNH
jgi:dihydroxy-acid dehydratase